MRLFLLLVFSSSLLAVDVQGTLIDGSSGGGPGSAEAVQLILLENTMQAVGVANEVRGDFTIRYDGDTEGKRFLLQAVKNGVFYTQSVSDLSSKLELTVYDVVDDAPIEASIGSMALYAYRQTIDIGLFYNLTNASDPPVTHFDPKGTFSFPLIPGGSGLEASTRRGSMPLRQQLALDGGMATLNYALKPGMTQLMVRTQHIYNPNEVNEYVLKLPNDQSSMHVLLLPTTLEAEGEGLEFIQDDKKENMRLYEFTREEGQSELRLKVSGKPLENPMPTGESAGAKDGHGQQPQAKIEARPNLLDRYRWQIIVSVLALFGIFTALGVRR